MNIKIVVLVIFAILLGSALAWHGSKHHNPTKAPTEAPHRGGGGGGGHNTPAPTQPPRQNTPAPTFQALNVWFFFWLLLLARAPLTYVHITATSSEPIKLLVPLYVYPGAAWDSVANAAKTGVKIIAIINPNSGPASSGPDSSYTTYMNKLTAAGVDMVGYVHTSYGARAVGDVNADIDTYASKYPGLKGIFLDEASASASEISYYTNVYNHIKSKSGYVNSILNPGTQPDQGYLAISSNIVIFEDAGSNLKNNYASWVKCAPSASQKSGYKYKFSGIAHSTSSGSMSGIINTMVSVLAMGLVYVTDGAAGCCTYNTLTSYLSQEASAVHALN
uniref:Spherulin-4 n=1 Tax=Physarum polycephalum TaxID=5791 RepID=SR4_PHYPO|nr:RecName: Full=Spherulin-4; Flags: Precursor [Physarum polycephalum]CAA32212.1 spherulin 4 precursor [Physarum polycephalum]